MPKVTTHFESVRMTLLLVFGRGRRRPPAAQAKTYIRSALAMPERTAPTIAA
jgi:hypothetical protein